MQSWKAFCGSGKHVIFSDTSSLFFIWFNITLKWKVFKTKFFLDQEKTFRDTYFMNNITPDRTVRIKETFCDNIWRSPRLNLHPVFFHKSLIHFADY